MAAFTWSLDWSSVANKAVARIILVASLLVVGGVPVRSQETLNDLVMRINRSQAIVTTFKPQGSTLNYSSGFFIAPDRIVTNLHLVDSARDIRIKTFTGRTISVGSVVARYPDADIAILETYEPAQDVIPLHVRKISGLVVNERDEAQWDVIAVPSENGWRFEHIATHLQIIASLAQATSGEPTIKLKGYLNGTAVSIPH